MSAATDIDMNDPVALLALFNAAENGTEPDMPATEVNPALAAAVAPAPAPAAVAPPASAAAATAAPAPATAFTPNPALVPVASATAQGAEPAGIATRDGQHIIPYSVLKADRERASRAEQEARDLRQQLATLQASQFNPTQAASAPGVKPGMLAASQQNDVARDEALAQLKEDFPTVYSELMAMQQQVQAQQAQLQPVAAQVRHAEQVQQQSIDEEIQSAIDATPKLAHIKATDPQAFELAKQFDNTLKDNPQWAGKPFAERFAKVVQLVEQMSGEITIPNYVAGTAHAAAPGKSSEQIKQEAIAIAQAAVRAASVPTSLSEFPAGQSATTDEREAIESMTHAQLAQKFARMTPDALDAYLKQL